MLSPYQLENLTRENLTSLVNGDLFLLERKYRALPNLDLRTFDWHVPSQLLRWDGERSWWNQLWRLAHYQWLKPFVISVWGVLYCHRYYYQRLKLFVISVWGAHYCHQYKSSRSDSEEIRDSRSNSEISNSGSLPARMRRHVTFTPDTVFVNQLTSKEYRTFTKQDDCWDSQRRQSCLELFCLKWTSAIFTFEASA